MLWPNDSSISYGRCGVKGRVIDNGGVLVYLICVPYCNTHYLCYMIGFIIFIIKQYGLY